MSQERPMAEATLPSARRPTPIRLDKIRRSPALTIVGLPELIGLAGAALLAILVVFAYLYFYVPARIRQRNADLDLIRLQELRKASGAELNRDLSIKDQVNEIAISLKTFEGNNLASQDPGRM